MVFYKNHQISASLIALSHWTKPHRRTSFVGFSPVVILNIYWIYTPPLLDIENKAIYMCPVFALPSSMLATVRTKFVLYMVTQTMYLNKVTCLMVGFLLLSVIQSSYLLKMQLIFRFSNKIVLTIYLVYFTKVFMSPSLVLETAAIWSKTACS